MNAIRFSLRSLLLFAAFVAIGTVSLRYASGMLSNCLWVAWLMFLAVTIVGVIYRRERERAFWVGCCIFGWAFAAHAHLFYGNATVHELIQSTYRSISWSTTVDVDTALAHRERGGSSITNGNAPATIFFPLEDPFKKAASVLFGGVVAVGGGLIAQWFHATRDRVANNGANPQ
ncbi:MAG TPA: hypothetical protein VNH11_01690 [Pirellulales bacterium]|nr:hypothetical protein [Pirellulales bacterium]